VFWTASHRTISNASAASSRVQRRLDIDLSQAALALVMIVIRMPYGHLERGSEKNDELLTQTLIIIRALYGPIES
jgi:hypothetical protein